MSPVAVAGDVYVVGRGAPGNGSRIWQGEFVDIAAAPEAFQPALTHLRALLARTLPEAKEITAASLRATRTGITFTPHKPLPDELVERLARASRSKTGA